MIRVTGNTVFSDDEINDLVSPFVGRELGFADLELLRDRLTHAYIQRGYVSSGALIPAQSLANGVLEVQLVEAALEAVVVETDGRFRPAYFRKRLEGAVTNPVNVYQIEEYLQVLQQDRRIRAVQAALVPGERRGESLLRVQVAENSWWHAQLEGGNYSSPAIGEARGRASVVVDNLTGWGDRLWTEYKGGEGLNDLWASYSVPVSLWDTKVELHLQRTWSEVVESPFDPLNIKARTATYGFTLSQPAYRSQNVKLEFFLTGDYRRSKTFLLGERFSFVPGPDDGLAELAVLRFGADSAYRSRTQVLAARSTLSVGINALGATKNSGDIPDGQFVTWLGQIQWARRLPWLDAQLITRADVQLASRPLLSLEQFSIGGHATVRGYRENTLVRDNGFVGSAELRLPVPLPRLAKWSLRFALVPFVDVGHSWNTDRPEFGPQTLVSVGIGGILHFGEHARFEVFWGERLKSVPDVGEWSLQDEGLQMRLTIDLP
jgi:hemolysin activation/secretion protein